MLNKLLSERKPAILKKWLNAVLDTYSAESNVFFKNLTDPSSNPAGTTISQGLGGCYELLLQDTNPHNALFFLEDVIKLRAVQEFSPSEALSFIFRLKDIVAEELKDELGDQRLFDELAAFGSRLDDLALTAFDFFIKCREKIFELKATEVQRWTFRQMQTANRVYESRKHENDLNFSATDTVKKRGN